MMDSRNTRRPRDPESEALARSAASCVAISFGLHALVIAALLYVRVDFSKPRLPPGAISVNLVSLPGPGAGPAAGQGGPPAQPAKPAEAPKPAPEKPAVSVAEPKPIPAAPPKPEISTAPPKIKEKKSLKAATKDTQKLIERAIDRIEKKVNEPDSSSVESAIERLKKKFGDAESTAPRPGPPGAAAGPGGGGGGPSGGGGGGGGPGQIEPIDIYRATVASNVERNWAFSPQLAGSEKNLWVGLVFKVLPSGEITDIRYSQRSNNAYLDDSAYKAIVKSSPVSPHPAMIKAPYVTVAIRFTPEGIR
jgi:colicin import membrane protein